MGNRATKGDTTGSGTTSETYNYDTVNRMTGGTAGSTSVFYTNDANGNTLTGGARTSTWDSENRLVKCVKSGATSEFVCGTDGLRRQMLVTDAGANGLSFLFGIGRE